ncbi:MAG: FAD/NAD(P)-binding protein [Phycisphaerae bacterium]|nr:FAD/NAD(P)-binding protein [Phycisphaerae bacterium]
MSECCCGEKDIYLPELATITRMQHMNETELFLHLELDSGKELGHMPGQFVEVSVAGIGEAPISNTSSPTKSGFDLVVRKIGRVTNAIHAMKEGDKLGIRGPLGHGYPLEDMKGKDLVFICGGIGLVPQRSLINYVLDKPEDFGKVAILFGAASFEQRLYQDQLARWAQNDKVQLLETIDKPHPEWSGNVGVVTTIMNQIDIDLANAISLICGPPIMYKFVIMSLEQANVSNENIFVNLERRMKCGVGKCGHCQINHHYACQSGPVFRYSDLSDIPEAI